jgi:hypothetical protein
MTSVVENSNLPITFLSNEQDFPSLIQWVESIPASHPPQNYLAIAVVIQQEIEPIIRNKGPQIVMQGNVLSSEIAQSRGFIRQWRDVTSSIVDPAFLPLLGSEGTPLKESMILIKIGTRVNKLRKVILFICHIDRDQSTLECFCRGAVQEIHRMRDTIIGSFSVSAQALMSDSPCFSDLADSAEPRLLAQDSTNQSIERSEQPVFALEPRGGLMLERHFDYGEREVNNTQLSLALDDDEILTTQTRHIIKSEFIDLRYEEDVMFSFG